MHILFIFLLVFATCTFGMDGSDVLRQIDEKMWPASYEMHRKLINVKSDGSKREYVMYTLKKGRDKVVNLFLEPPEEKGRVILRVGGNLWLRIPDVEQALRVSSMHSVVGGIFNNWDLMLSDFSAEYEVQEMKTEKDTYILTLKANGKWAILRQVETAGRKTGPAAAQARSLLQFGHPDQDRYVPRHKGLWRRHCPTRASRDREPAVARR